ncbi:MAG: hypothetical protein IPN62_17155 [Flavobacteriales bacterium]|nr:hypothetical protein [Flavobacteriales bacterium]
MAQRTKLTVGVFDLDQHVKVIRKNIVVTSLHNSYVMKLEDPGWFLKTLSLGQIQGLKTLDIDMNAYALSLTKRKKHINESLSKIFSKNEKSAIFESYSSFIQSLNSDTRLLLRRMDERRAEIMNHNAVEARTAAGWGKVYSGTKLAADIAIMVLGKPVDAIIPGAGTSIAYGYTLTTEVAGVAAAADADIWAFKGSMSAPWLMAWGEARPKLKSFPIRGKLIQGPVIVEGLMALVDAYGNWNKFD